jgi:N6-L-threonylcarbamoyladenine synthase
LRTALTGAASEDGFSLYVPAPALCTDNAAMIAAAGTWALDRGERGTLDLSVDPGLPLA